MILCNVTLEIGLLQVVFLTTLFYLLNSSGDLYKPVEIMTNFSPSGNRVGLALESAINGVFAASFKMATFYGLWTWFIHNLFGVRIVYLPSGKHSIKSSCMYDVFDSLIQHLPQFLELFPSLALIGQAFQLFWIYG